MYHFPRNFELEETWSGCISLFFLQLKMSHLYFWTIICIKMTWKSILLKNICQSHNNFILSTTISAFPRSVRYYYSHGCLFLVDSDQGGFFPFSNIVTKSIIYSSHSRTVVLNLLMLQPINTLLILVSPTVKSFLLLHYKYNFATFMYYNSIYVFWCS